jgi:uncharacterized protein
VSSRLKACWAAIVVLSLNLLCTGEKVSELQPTGYVNDFAHVLNPTTRTQIEDLCTQVDQKAHAQIALVTINTLEGSDIESFAVDLFKKWGIGQKATDRGVLILYAIQDHRARIEVGYGLEPILPDGKVGGFQREAIPLISSQNYNDALLLVTTRVADVIATDAGIQLTGSRPRAPTQPEQPDTGISLGGIAIIAIIVLIVLFTPLRTLLFWMLFSSIFGGGRRGGWGVEGGVEAAASVEAEGLAASAAAVLVAAEPVVVGRMARTK